MPRLQIVYTGREPAAEMRSALEQGLGLAAHASDVAPADATMAVRSQLAHNAHLGVLPPDALCRPPCQGLLLIIDMLTGGDQADEPLLGAGWDILPLSLGVGSADGLVMCATRPCGQPTDCIGG